MKNKFEFRRRTLAMLLALVMVLSIYPMGALAEDVSPMAETRPLSSAATTPLPPRAQELIGAGGVPTGYLIYPAPQSIDYLAGGFVLDTAHVSITPGASDATRDRIATVLEDAGVSNVTTSPALVLDRRNTNIILGIVDDCPQFTAFFDAANFADTSALDPVPGTYDGYVLGTHNGDIIIMGRCATSLFYGVMTLRQMLAHGTTLRNVLINDFADSEVRGVVEGFYGVPWSHETRLNMLEMMGQYKLNSFVYAPKDDPFHFGEGWYREYPEDMQREFRELVEVAEANHVSFVWTVHVSPHMDFFDGDDEFNATRPVVQGRQWTENDRSTGRSVTAAGAVGSPTPQNSVDWPVFASQRVIDSFSEEETFERMYAKFDHMYDLGIRQFGFLIDDINFEEARFNTPFHVTAANRLVAWGERQESEIGPLLLCPAYYYQADIQSGIPWSGRSSMRTLRGDPWADLVVVPAFAAGGPVEDANAAGGANQPAAWPEWNGPEVTYPQPGLHSDIQVFYTGSHVMSNITGNSMRWFYGDHVPTMVAPPVGEASTPVLSSTHGFVYPAALPGQMPNAARLASLDISLATDPAVTFELYPAFDEDTFAYSIVVPNNIANRNQLTLDIVGADGATVSFADSLGIPVGSGQMFLITVTATDGTTQIYRLFFNREGTVPNTPEGNVACPPGHPDRCQNCVDGRPCRWTLSGMQRRPLVWWNYPVHDYDGNNIRLFMGPTPVQRNAAGEVMAQSLNPSTKGTIQGLVANPMQQGHLSEVALFGVADFTWNMSDFDPVQNWEDSFHYLFPEVADSMFDFAEHNQWRTGGTPLLNNVESTELLPYLLAFLDTIADNMGGLHADVSNPFSHAAMNLSPLTLRAPATLNAAEVRSAGVALLAELADFEAAALDILENGSELLLHDIGPWAEKAISIVETIRALVDMYDAYFDNDPVATWENYTRALAQRYNWPNITAPMLNDGVIIVEIGTQRIRPFVNFLFAAGDALMDYYSPVDEQVREDSVFTNIPALQDELIDTDAFTRTLSLDEVAALGVHRYVGIQLDNLRKLAGIGIDGTLPAGLIVEYSANGADWAPVPETFGGQPVRYIRILNDTDAAISIAGLDAISVTVRPGDGMPEGVVTTARGNNGIPMGIHNQHVPGNLLTYSLDPVDGNRQSFWMNHLQYPGDTVNVRYNEPQKVYDITLYSDNGDNILAGRMEVSMDGEEWTEVMAIGADITLEPFYGRNYIVERAFLGEEGMTFQYLRITNDTPRNGWMRLHSLRLNERAGHLYGIIPNTALEDGRPAPTVVDGRMSSLFFAEESNTLTYTLHEGTNASELIVLQNISYTNNAPIRALTEDGWVELGVLDEAFWSYDVSQFGRLLKVEIGWDEATAPIMLHAIGTVADADKADLLARMAVVAADAYLSERLALELLMAEAVADDPHASVREVETAYARLFTEAALLTLEAVGGTLSPAFAPDVFAYTMAVAYDVTELALHYTLPTGARVEIDGPVDNLAVGPNTITITVTSGDGATVEVYTITVTRAVPTLLLVPDAVTLENAARNMPTTTVTVAVRGTATGDITLNTDALPVGVTAAVVNNSIVVTGTRPAHDGPEIPVGPHEIIVTRGGVSATLPVTVNLTPFPAPTQNEPETEIGLEVDEDGTVTITVTPEGEVAVDEDGNIVITLPAGTPEDEIALELPEGWGYEVETDEDGNVTVVITPPSGHRVIEAPSDSDNLMVVEFHEAYMFGNDRGEFRPGGAITRAEVAAILARVMIDEFDSSVDRTDYELPPGMDSFSVFPDVTPNNWFYHYVAWVHHAELVLGDDYGNFRPNAPISRQELAMMIARIDGVAETAGEMSFGDAEDIAGWARAAVYTVYRDDLMQGDDQGNFRPRANITRAEVATVMNRILGRLDSRDAYDAADVGRDNARTFPDIAANANPMRWYFPSVLAAANDHYLTRDNDGNIAWVHVRVQPQR